MKKNILLENHILFYLEVYDLFDRYYHETSIYIEIIKFIVFISEMIVYIYKHDYISMNCSINYLHNFLSFSEFIMKIQNTRVYKTKLNSSYILQT